MSQQINFTRTSSNNQRIRMYRLNLNFCECNQKKYFAKKYFTQLTKNVDLPISIQQNHFHVN